MSNTRLLLLFQLHLDKQLNAAERQELLGILSDPTYEEDVKDLLNHFWEEFEPEIPLFSEQQSKRILDTVLAVKAEQQHGIINLRKWKRNIAAAAVLLLICSISLLFISNPKSSKKLPSLSLESGKPLPYSGVSDGGDNKALLTLSDGRKIVLNDLSKGEILNQSGIRIVKAKDGQLVYSATQQSQNNATENPVTEYNTISTPKGGQYQVNLPDGSKVWLNAMSSLKFPTKFQGNERAVELTGEAYFEISAFYSGNVKLPFKVRSISEGKRQEVEVLGTHFNINAYPNVPSTRTTLLEGSVKITNLNSKDVHIITPGQQAILAGNRSSVIRANLEDAMAWKNGNFQFNNLELTEIMKELERWYDIKVDYSNIPDTRYHGYISKKVSLTQVLDMLELTGNVRFKISAMPGNSAKVIQIIPE